MLMDRIVLAETPLPNVSRIAVALQSPFSPVFDKESTEMDFEAARWTLLQDFLRVPETEVFSINSVYAWTLKDLKNVEKWLKMIRRIAGAKHSTFASDSAKVFSTRTTPVWIVHPEILFDEK